MPPYRPPYVLECVELAMGRKASAIRRDMNRRVNRLAAIASVAPFFGFFGTVLGILGSFRSFGTSKSVIIAYTAYGVAQALVPTILGLFVALVAHCFHRYVDLQVQTFEVEMNCASTDLLNHLTAYLHALRVAGTAALPNPIGRN